MYPKKTLSAASLLSESEFSMGIAATCPFIMSEQNPRTIKLHHQYMHEVTIKHFDKLKSLFTN